MNEIKLGIIGSNFVSDWMCDAVAESGGIASRAVYSRTLEKGTEFAAKHNIPNVFTDMEKFLSSDIDAVYIAVPNYMHFPYAMNAMRHRKHVLVEKPAALDEAQFAEMEKCAFDNGVVLMEAMRPLHDPALDIIRQAMNNIGTVRHATFDFCQYSSRYDKFRSGEILNAFNPLYGNAALMDIGVYAVSCAAALFGEPKSVYSRSVILRNGMEGMGRVFLEYDSCQAEVIYSKITESQTPSTIIGEDGAILIGKLSMLDSVKLIRRLRNTGNGTNDNSEEILLADRKESNMIYEVKDFIKLVNGESVNGSSWNCNTRIVMRIMDEIRRQNKIEF